jgi:hypothetical protein
VGLPQSTTGRFPPRDRETRCRAPRLHHTPPSAPAMASRRPPGESSPSPGRVSSGSG